MRRTWLELIVLVVARFFGSIYQIYAQELRRDDPFAYLNNSRSGVPSKTPILSRWKSDLRYSWNMFKRDHPQIGRAAYFLGGWLKPQGKPRAKKPEADQKTADKKKRTCRHERVHRGITTLFDGDVELCVRQWRSYCLDCGHDWPIDVPEGCEQFWTEQKPRRMC